MFHSFVFRVWGIGSKKKESDKLVINGWRALNVKTRIWKESWTCQIGVMWVILVNSFAAAVSGAHKHTGFCKQTVRSFTFHFYHSKWREENNFEEENKLVKPNTLILLPVLKAAAHMIWGCKFDFMCDCKKKICIKQAFINTAWLDFRSIRFEHTTWKTQTNSTLSCVNYIGSLLHTHRTDPPSQQSCCLCCIQNLMDSECYSDGCWRLLNTI